MMNKTIGVWFSCGVASAVAAKLTLDLYGKENNVIILNNPVIEEDEDNLRFKDDISQWLKVEILTVENSKFPDHSAVTVWGKRRYMSGIKGAPCTQELKKKARQEYESNNHIDYHVLGFTSDEFKRHERFILNERDNVLPVLIDAGITKDECFKIINEAGIALPRVYSMGLSLIHI